MSLTGFIIGCVTRKSARRFERASQDPSGVQERKLLSMVQQNAETDYGRRHGFGSIGSVEDYRKSVPVISYENIRADMDRVLAGEKRIFTTEDPVMFAQTSGTTGKAKNIPVTPTCQGREHKDQSRTWLYHVKKDHPRVYDRKIVTLVSPAIEGYAPSGVPFGSTSGHIYKNMPGIVRKAYAVPYEVFEIEDYQAKYYAIMRTALEQDVGFLCTANPSSILKMCEKANEFSEHIIRDVRDGTLCKDYHIRRSVRDALEPAYKPNPARAHLLDQARLRRAGILRPADYWPNLVLIACWKGGTVGHYIDKFQPWIDPDGERSVPVRDWGYLSSEARGSIPLSDTGSKGALTITANFFEFVPPGDVASNPDDFSKWTYLTADQLEIGGEYYIFVTTTGGLYRYDINDIIKVEGRYNKTPEIVFLRKGRGMTNITGEKVSVNQIIDSVDKASTTTGAVPDHFKAEADSDNSRYVLRVEFATTVDDDCRRRFLECVDKGLKHINIEYKTKRDSQRLKAPVMHVMKHGWYERQRKRQVEEGKRAFQAKTELLSPMKMETTAITPDLEAVVEMDSQA